MTVQNPPNRERFEPNSWEDVVGNYDAKSYCKDVLHCVRVHGQRSGFNALISGLSRSGKTAIVTFLIKCLLCSRFNFKTLNPCNKCEHCTDSFHLLGNNGWEDFVNLLEESGTTVPTRFLPIDCARASERDIEDCLNKVSYGSDCLQIVYLDETHHLAKRSMDERFLKPMETYPAIWIATTANVKKDCEKDSGKLDKMFQNRFDYRIETQKPTEKEMVAWLAKRCEDFGIDVDNSWRTLALLSERSKFLPGMALHVLNKAKNSRSRILNEKLVNAHIFDLDD